MPLKLEDLGFKVGDIVTYDSDEESTGGVVFVISQNYDSPVEDTERRTYGKKHHDSKGKLLKPMEVMGYIRLKPLFKFFPTERGAKPKGAGATVLIHHTTIKADIQQTWRKARLFKVDVLSLASKYAELGNVVRDLAIMHGMVPGGSQPADEAHDSPQE